MNDQTIAQFTDEVLAQRAAERRAAAVTTVPPTHMCSPLEHADNLILFMMEMGINDVVAEHHPTLDLARFRLVESDDPNVQALGYYLGLTAILHTPDALRKAVEELRARLSEGLPIDW